jgi:serine/threonine protein kinase
MLGATVAEKYKLVRLLGSGTMGAVYEGVHLDIGKRLAIKFIHPEFVESTAVVGRFRREARAASAVDSEHIAQIFDFGRDEKLGLYMVIEYLEGEDLEARLAREKWLPERDAATIALHVGRGLARAHAAGIVHRDLKPANIFLSRRDDGTVLAKILDFGISKFEADHAPKSRAEPELTEHGTTLGTPQYMCPEQCEGKVELDERADVWALGAVLYEMLAGAPAIADAGGVLATLQRIVSKNVPPLASRASWVRAPLAALVDAALVRDRDQRIPSASTFVSRLVEAMPDAASQPSLGPMLRSTDVSELRPPSSGSLPVSSSDPELVGRFTVPAPPPEMTGGAELIAHDSAPPPSSEEGAPSSEDALRVFSRNAGIPEELLALRRKKKDPLL